MKYIFAVLFFALLCMCGLCAQTTIDAVVGNSGTVSAAAPDAKGKAVSEKTDAGVSEDMMLPEEAMGALALGGAQEIDAKAAKKAAKAVKKAEKEAKLEAKIASGKFFVMFNYGAALTWVNRVKKQSGRSNFVFEDFLVGAYFAAETRNFPKLKWLNLMGRLAFYYPLSYKFNKHPQLISQPLAFALDVSVFPLFRINIKEVVFINVAAPGFHYLFQKSDRFLYSDMGVVGMLGVELPIAKRWGFLLSGFASYDFGNLGTNSRMEPYDHVWQYQLSIGMRYTKRGPYKKSYVGMISEAVKRNKEKKAARTR